MRRSHISAAACVGPKNCGAARKNTPGAFGTINGCCGSNLRWLRDHLRIKKKPANEGPGRDQAALSRCEKAPPGPGSSKHSQRAAPRTRASAGRSAFRLWISGEKVRMQSPVIISSSLMKSPRRRAGDGSGAVIEAQPGVAPCLTTEGDGRGRGGR